VILAYHLAYAAFVFTSQCFEQGYPHDAVQVPQPGDVLRQLVVLHKPSIFRLILLRFRFGACKAQAEIIRVADIPQSPVLGVVGVSLWKLPSLLVQ
jgi:hypothetical protein